MHGLCLFNKFYVTLLLIGQVIRSLVRPQGGFIIFNYI
jgi:hypothetical protein